MQLGKTTFFSLAEALFSESKDPPAFSLKYMAVEKDRHAWFVLYLDFGSVTSVTSGISDG